jgi:hypothetical protein
VVNHTYASQHRSLLAGHSRAENECGMLWSAEGTTTAASPANYLHYFGAHLIELSVTMRGSVASDKAVIVVFPDKKQAGSLHSAATETRRVIDTSASAKKCGGKALKSLVKEW